jgi:glutamate carboxypeptidase
MTFFAVLFFLDPLQAQLSSPEKKLVNHIDQNTQAALKFWEEVVNVNSGTMNFDGVQKVGILFQVKLDALGFTTRWVDGKPFNRAGHLIAEHRGKKNRKTILLIGHLDTVFELSNPFQQFKFVNDSTAYGPGLADMKGGDVVMLLALQALNATRLLQDMNIIVVMSGDEESSGDPLELARHDLIEAAKEADIAIGFEDGDGRFETANIARRSSTDWQLKVTGVPSHSSQIFTEKTGAGAIFEASRIVNEFYQTLSSEPNLTFNPALFLGGTNVVSNTDMNEGKADGKNNVVPKEVIVTGDIRALSPEQLQKAREKMKEIVSRHLPKTEAQLTFGEGYPALAPTPGNYQLLKYFDRVSHDLGYGTVRAVNPRDAGAADISFTSGYVDMAMDGLGLRSSGGHTVNEMADPRTLPMQSKRAAVLLYRLCYDKVAGH